MRLWSLHPDRQQHTSGFSRELWAPFVGATEVATGFAGKSLRDFRRSYMSRGFAATGFSRATKNAGRRTCRRPFDAGAYLRRDRRFLLAQAVGRSSAGKRTELAQRGLHARAVGRVRLWRAEARRGG